MANTLTHPPPPAPSTFWIIDKKLETLHFDALWLKKEQELFTCDGVRFKVMQPDATDATDASDRKWYHHTIVPVESSTVWTCMWEYGQNSMFRSSYSYGKDTRCSLKRGCSCHSAYNGNIPGNLCLKSALNMNNHKPNSVLKWQDHFKIVNALCDYIDLREYYWNMSIRCVWPASHGNFSNA
jgi:hypothetical protein